MSIIACNSAGIQALRDLSSTLTDSKEEILSATSSLENSVDEHAQHLGPLAATINGSIEEIRSAVNSSSEPIDELAEKLKDLAAAYEEFMGSSGN